MHTDTLTELGLSPNEAKIYEALLELQEASVAEIATKANVHRRNAYDAINRLVEKGMLFQVLSGSDNLYAPVDPSKLSELLEEKRKKLDTALPQMQELFEKGKREERAYVYHGEEGFKNQMRDILRAGQDMYTIGGKAAWLDYADEPFFKQFWKEAQKKNMKFYILFDEEVGDRAHGFDTFPNFSYRFLPKQYASAGAIDIYADRVAIVPQWKPGSKGSAKDASFFLLSSWDLADSYRAWFDFMWDKAKKVKQ